MRRRLGPAAGLALLGLLSACAALPEQGAVQVVDGPAATSSAAPFDFDPPGPERGATQEQVVAGFLRAMQATPASTTAAIEFLTEEAAATWRPDRRTVVYDALTSRRVAGAVTVALDGAFVLDSHGRWRGRPEAPRVRFELRREGGEWRISGPPDAMVIPRTHFATRYRGYSLYFFDPSGSVLVPEPVYLPGGPQAATELVQGLLAGPPPSTRDLLRTFFPPETELGVSVPVSEDGVADVPLNAAVADLDDVSRGLVLAQLAWTLRQVAEVRGVRLTVDGTPLEHPSGRETVPVSEWAEHDPTIASASTDLFGLRDQAVVRVAGDTEIEAVALAGLGPAGGRSLGVDMSGRRFAVLSSDRTRVVVLRAAGEDGARTVHTGGDLLRPMWDRTDRLWLLDRRDGGLDVRVVGERRTLRLTAPGVGRRVVAAALSRDGSRLGLAVRAGRSTEVLVARVVRTGRGRPVRLTAAHPVSTTVPLRTVRDMGWRDPTTLALLTRPTPTTTEIVLASADGASGAVALAQRPELLYDAGVGLATSPGGPQALIVRTADGALHELGPDGLWDLDALAPGLRAPTFVG